MDLLSMTLLGIVSLLVALLVPFVSLRVKVFGFSRPLSSIQNIHGEGLRTIPDTINCEDLHYHEPSNLLFAACENNPMSRLSWFPPLPLPHFQDHTAASRGYIQVIDPTTFTSKRLLLEGFVGDFVTHGIDIWHSRNDPNSVYFFAINHLPNPEFYENKGTVSSKIHKAKSQIEIFHYTIGSSSAKHLRSVLHPLIRTPNDIYAVNASSFYVTNDHYYREGVLRTVEDIGFQRFTPWTDLVHVSVRTPSTKDPYEGIDVTVALAGMHNNNGLGHGKAEEDIAIGDASGGKLFIGVREPKPENPAAIRIVQPIQFASTIDNPSYFNDIYAESTGSDASGYVMAGLARACDLVRNAADPNSQIPVMVWLARPITSGQRDVDGDGWNKTLVFQDDGLAIRTASTAVIIPIDPAENNGRKQGWLFVAGFLSTAIVATKIDLN